jgi:hypothetical protein
VAELAACYTGRETVVADRYLLIHVLVGKGVGSSGHGTNEDADALTRVQLLHVFSDSDYFCVETEGDLAAVWWQVVSDWVLYDFEELFLRVGGSNGKSVKKLDHETRETFKCTRNSNGWADFDQYTFRSGDVDLQSSGLVNG